MLEHELLADKGILIARPKGPLSERDFSPLSADADAYIQTHGGLNGLVILVEEFPGWEDIGGFIAHFKFVRDHHKKISKVAFVSDSDLLALMPIVANHFISADVKHFKGNEQAKAIAWIGGETS